MGLKMTNINTLLLKHVKYGKGAAQHLRSNCSDLLSSLEKFLQSRTHITRYDNARALGKLVLYKFNRHGLAHIRDIAANQELRQLTKYKNQIDHTSHTVYLFLLGIWFYDNHPKINNAIQNIYSNRTRLEKNANFLSQWICSSLLNDIGYVYFDLEDETKNDRRSIDSLYTWENLKEITKGINCKTQKTLKEIHNEFYKKYLKVMPLPTHLYNSNTRRDIINRLSSIPWVGELNPQWEGYNSFILLDPNEINKEFTKLQEYAYYIIEHKSHGKHKYIDPSIAGGLILLQYSLYWCWIFKRLRELENTSYIDVAGAEDFNIQNFIEKELPTCRSIAYHNINPEISTGIDLIKKITLEKEPICYLSILCDELHIWDRFASSAIYLEDFRNYKRYSLEANDITLSVCGSNDINTKIECCIQNDSFDVNIMKEKIKRLNGVEDLIIITKIPEV